MVRRLLASSDQIAASRLSEIEIASAVTRRQREGALTLRDRERVLAALDSDFAAMVVVELTPAVCAAARELLQRRSLRAGDAAQLASCLYLREQLRQPVGFVGYDARLTQAALAEGLEVEPVGELSQ